jgi:lambda family phage minor tail protein L
MSDYLIATDLQSQEVSKGVITLYDITLLNQSTLYFHSEDSADVAIGAGAEIGEIRFGGNDYQLLPIVLEGLEVTADGAANRPTLKISNVESLINNSPTSPFVAQTPDFKIEDLLGATIVRHRTLNDTNYLSQGYEFPKATYIVDRITSKNSLMVELELASPFDLGEARIPSRVVVGKYCPWMYKKGIQGESPQKSGCIWKSNFFIKDANTEVYFYFNDMNEPLLDKGSLESELEAFFDPSPAIPGSYSIDNFILYLGRYYRSEIDSNTIDTGNPPSDNPNWQKCRVYTDWDNSTNYTVDTSEFRNSSLVEHNFKIYRATKNNINKEPGIETKYWVEEDKCGKLLTSCRARFQVIRVAGTSNDYPSAVLYSKTQSLPFGGFPGSKKFR